jgi:hypothetical protein
MDGTIEGISGSEGATGFTLVVPGRKSVSSASGLARKDKRIESVDVVNFPDRCEITVRFKSEVPAFLARFKDKNLLIEVGADGSKKDGDAHSVRSKDDENSPKKAGGSKKKSEVKSASSGDDGNGKKRTKKGDAKKSEPQKSEPKKGDATASAANGAGGSKKSDAKPSTTSAAGGSKKSDAKKGDKGAG